MGDITQLLTDVRKGNNAPAESELVGLIYSDLYRIASLHMKRERGDHTLQASILVHDACLELIRDPNQLWKNRGEFFAAAYQYMHRLLVNHARARKTTKRGGGQVRLPLDDVFAYSDAKWDEFLNVDQALERLAQLDPQQAKIVELRYFAGLTVEEIAVHLKISIRTVHRDWHTARVWLHRYLSDPKPEDE